jgi:hypothetical protein
VHADPPGVLAQADVRRVADAMPPPCAQASARWQGMAVRELGAGVTVLHRGAVLAEGAIDAIRDIEAVRDVYLGKRHARG